MATFRDIQLGYDPGAQLQFNRQQSQQVGQSVPEEDVSSQILGLLQQYQKFGRGQLAGAQQEQARRLGSETSKELIGASPTVQSGVRKAQTEALEPTIGGARDLLTQAKDLMTEFQQSEEKKRTQAANLLQTAIGVGSEALEGLLKTQPDLFKQAGVDPKSAEFFITSLKRKESEARQKTEAARIKPATGEQRQTLAFYNRGQQAHENALAVETKVAKLGTGGQLRQRFAPDFFKSPAGKLYSQAQRTFTEARLRKESGAAIPESELENDARTYFAQPGDTPAVIAQKRAGRQKVLQGLAFSSGPAYEEFYGIPYVPARGQVIQKGNRSFQAIP